MTPNRITVFLPCHSLDDVPTRLDEREADELLAAWTASWHPALVAETRAPPAWASVDLPASQGAALGIVPPAWDDRFAAQIDVKSTAGVTVVRGARDVAAIQRAAADCLGLPAGELAGESLAADFHALGLAALLAEMLARRMRTRADLASTGFPGAVVTAAAAAVAGDDWAAKAALQEAFDAISASRGRYYPVDSYAVDLVLTASTTNGDRLAEAIASQVPVAVAMTGQGIEALARSSPRAVENLRAAVADGRVELCGGRETDAAIDCATPEAVAASFVAGNKAIHRHLGVAPASFARSGGGATPLLVPILAGFGFEGGIWSLFDGSSLPDVGTGMIRWRAADAAIDMLAAAPLDARLAGTVLAIPETLGTALDRDHVAAVLFAHHAGTASRWHDLIRRIGRWSTLLGTFVTPGELARRAAGAGTVVSLEPDAFPAVSPRTAAAIPAAVESAIAEAAAIVAAAAPLGGRRPEVSPPRRTVTETASPFHRLSLVFRGRTRSDHQRLTLDNGLIRVEVHPATGGLLAVRRTPEAANRLSQQLAVRTPQAPADGAEAPSSSHDGAWTRMVADAVERTRLADGTEAILATGRLVADDGVVAARFRQQVQLSDRLPLALIDVEVRLERPLEGPLFESHVAARFAWHENEHVEIRRSLLTQSIVTERTRFTAPHFVEIVPDGGRFDSDTDRVTILTGGLPWHVRSTPHVLDSLLAGGDGATVSRRLGVGLGLQAPWDAALAMVAGTPIDARMTGLPANVRLTVRGVLVADGRLKAARIGLLESAGRAGTVAIDWPRAVGEAMVVDFQGNRLAAPAVAIEGSRTVLSLDRYQWLQLDLGFAE